jgi:4-hydroxythreonine-4-phosphate dehydrogenase
MNTNKIKVGITHGDINGISYEVITKALMDNRIQDFCSTIVYGSPKVAAYHRKALDIDNFSFNNIKSPGEANLKRPNILNCVDDQVRVELGKSTEIAGKASVESLLTAVRDLKNGLIDVLVTGPINKKNVQSEDFQFTGHTSYFESEFPTDSGALMLMVHEQFKVGLVTAHIPLSRVVDFISFESVLSKLRSMNESLKIDFGLSKPNIAVLGLNPHAGDDGLLGGEEKEIIEPAIKEARKEGIMAMGTFPADGFFGSYNHLKFDAVLAMYHDQGLSPFKTLGFSDGVNYTAGLPIIRTSPVHGTGYDIAGQGVASATSFRNALYLAIDIFKQRKQYKELAANPLQVQEKNNDRSNSK